MTDKTCNTASETVSQAVLLSRNAELKLPMQR